MKKEVGKDLKEAVQIKVPKMEGSILAPQLWNYISKKRGERSLCNSK